MMHVSTRSYYYGEPSQLTCELLNTLYAQNGKSRVTMFREVISAYE